jgi:hypothetical protein
LIKWLTVLFFRNAKWRARDISKHHQREMTLAPHDDDDDVNPIEREPDRDKSESMDEMSERELFKIMKDAVYRKFTKPYQRALFDAWMEAMETYGNRLVFKRHVFPAIMDEYGTPITTLTDNILQMRKVVANALSKMGYDRIPKKFLSFDVGIVDRVACYGYIRRLSRWVVAGSVVNYSLVPDVPFLTKKG